MQSVLYRLLQFTRVVLPLTFLSMVLVCYMSVDSTAQQKTKDEWTFVSIPDFLNVDVKYPEPKWEEALSYVLESIKAEDPDFVLIAGDLVMGRWWRDVDQINELSEFYYSAWTRRMQDHGLKYYAAVGDHELGDNPWVRGGMREKEAMGTMHCTDLNNVSYYEDAFRKYLKMPLNGPSHMRGLAYYFVHKNSLFVSVDVFEKNMMGTAGRGLASVTGAQLKWLEQILAAHDDVDHIIVMGHTPILGPVRWKYSSRLMLAKGQDSELWQTMKKNNVDLYLCGEVHAMTCIEADGIEQISHGALFGYDTTSNYMVVKVTPTSIKLELKEINTIISGDYVSQSFGNQPREYVQISKEEQKRGFQTVGTMTVDKTGGKKAFVRKTGYFTEEGNPTDMNH